MTSVEQRTSVQSNLYLSMVAWTGLNEDYAMSLGNVTDGPPSVDFTYNLTRFLELAVAV